MKPALRWLFLVAAHAAMLQAAVDDPFQALRKYNGQAPGAPAAIAAEIRRTQGDAAAWAQIEQRLLDVLADPQTTPSGKREVCRLLRLVGTARCVPALAPLLLDAQLCDPACWVLQPLADPAAGQALLAALDRAGGPAKLALIDALGERREAAAVPLLVKLTAHHVLEVSLAAVRALGRIGNADAVAALRQMGRSAPVCRALLLAAQRLLADGQVAEAQAVLAELAAGPPPAVRGAALEGLVASRAPGALDAVLAGLKSPDKLVWQGAGKLVSQFGAGATPKVLAVYASLPPAAQAVVLTALAEAGQTAAAPQVAAALRSDDSDLRLAAMRAAVRIGGAAAVVPLVELAARGGERQPAREALMLIRGREAAAAIARLAVDGSPEQRAVVLELLPDRNDRAAVPLLLTVAGGGERKLATAAWKALARLAGAEDYPKLVDLLVRIGDDRVRYTAQSAVVQAARRLPSTDAALPPVLAAMAAAKGDVLTSLIVVLAGIGGDRAVAEITKHTASTDPEVKRAAIEALVNDCDDPKALPTLLAIAREDAQAGLRSLALRGFLRIVDGDERMRPADKAKRLGEAMAAARTPGDKIAVLGALRNCRVSAAVQLAATLLDDRELNGEAVSTILYLASEQKQGNRKLAAVKGAEVKAALEKVVATTTSTTMREQARKLLK